MTINNLNQTPILHEVFSVSATNNEDIFILDVDITDMRGERSRCQYVSAPDDDYGLAPYIRNWLVENASEYEIIPFVPPTIEEIRSHMPTLTQRQFWIAVVSIGVSKEEVLAAVDAIEDVMERARMRIEITEAAAYERTNPYIDDLSGILGISSEELDALWNWAAGI